MCASRCVCRRGLTLLDQVPQHAEGVLTAEAAGGGDDVFEGGAGGAEGLEGAGNGALVLAAVGERGLAQQPPAAAGELERPVAADDIAGVEAQPALGGVALAVERQDRVIESPNSRRYHKDTKTQSIRVHKKKLRA